MQHRVHGDGDQTGPACIFDDRHWGRDLSRASLWEKGYCIRIVLDETTVTCIFVDGGSAL